MTPRYGLKKGRIISVLKKGYGQYSLDRAQSRVRWITVEVSFRSYARDTAWKRAELSVFLNVETVQYVADRAASRVRWITALRASFRHMPRDTAWKRAELSSVLNARITGQYSNLIVLYLEVRWITVTWVSVIMPVDYGLKKGRIISVLKKLKSVSIRWSPLFSSAVDNRLREYLRHMPRDTAWKRAELSVLLEKRNGQYSLIVLFPSTVNNRRRESIFICPWSGITTCRWWALRLRWTFEKRIFIVIWFSWVDRTG